MDYSESDKSIKKTARRIALIGLGKAGRTIHLPALKKLKNVQIVGAYDVQGGGEALGLPSFSSVDQMLAEARPDMVAALQKRINVLAKECVKPLFLVDQFKVVQTNMDGEPVMPTDEEYSGVETP